LLYFHGNPSSRIWNPGEDATNAAGVRLIIPDRPGVGRSDPKPGRSAADWPGDVVELADALGIGKFAIIGCSAGGPSAAACAAIIPERLTAVGVVNSSTCAKYNWEENPGVEASWTESDQAEFALMRRDVAAGTRLAVANLVESIADMEAHPQAINDDLAQAEGDRWFFTDPARVEIFDAHIRENWRQGAEAVVCEYACVYFPWGFRLADIQIPVHFWHGSQDPWVNRADVDFQVNAIPDCSLVVWEDAGHLGFVKHFDEVLATLTA
jgi:pimeloyl-ACP methyl ester carboxylesterase